MTAPLVFCDTETDGVHPHRKVWEVAMIRRDDQGERELQFFVQIDLRSADPFGLQVGGFYERHPFGRKLAGAEPAPVPPAKSSIEASMLVAKWTHGAHIVGAVPNFDTEVLAGMLRAHGLAPAWHHHLVDVENLAVGWLAGRGTPFAPPWKSDDLGRLLGVEPASEADRHTALGDARWVMRIYDAILGAAA